MKIIIVRHHHRLTKSSCREVPRLFYFPFKFLYMIKVYIMKKYPFLKVKTNRNQPKIKFGQPTFTTYSYTDKKDGKKRKVVKCTIESWVQKLPNGVLIDAESRETGTFLPYPEVCSIKTCGKAVCDEQDFISGKFDQDLGERVARFRAEQKAFQRHAKHIKARVERIISYYQGTLNAFTSQAAKVASDKVVWK